MADDVQFQSATLATPAAGVTVATDEVGGAHFQRVKLDLGGDGVSVPVVTTMPVSDGGGSLTVDGAVSVSNFPVSQPVTGPLTDTQLRAAAVPVSGTFFQATQPVSGPVTDAQLRATAVPVSAASLPLPTGAATETTLGTRLTESDFDSKTGSLTETAPASDTASSGLNGRLQRIAQRLTSLIALLPGSLGQKAKAASLAVTLASDQDALPVTGTFFQATQPVSAASLPLPTGAATETTLAAQSAKLPATLGQKAKASALAVTLASDEDILTLNGAVTETAPASDTASSGLNGRLQRIAQRLTSLIALIPAALGQGTMAQSLRVVVASDQSTLPSGGNVAHDAVDSGNPLKIGGKAYSPDSGPADVASGDRADLFMDLKGRPVVYWGTALDETNDKVRAVTEGYKTTYSAAFVGLAPAVAATDILEIIGSATKTIRVLRVQVSGVATAAGAYNVQLIKRSTAATAGTSTSAAIVPHDANDAAGTAVVKGYTANPTLGTVVGTVRSQRVTVSTAAGAIPIVPVAFEFTTRNGKGIVLRGVAQTLCLNLNGVTMTGGVLDIDVEFTEE